MRKFQSVLDYSLDLIKLRDTYAKVYRNKKFSFKNGAKEYSLEVVNVTFSYSYKSFNKSGKNTYIKDGYTFAECSFNDGVALNNEGELIGIQTNIAICSPLSDDVLGKNFKYEEGTYKQVGTFETLLSRADLRKHLYRYGFYINGKHYVRFKRSSGSARVGKCLFIDEALYSRMAKWDMCGLKIREGQKIDLSSYEAYIALSSSSIIDTIEIKPENILLINDYESVFKDDIIAVEYLNECLTSAHKTTEVTNSIWDGQSLLDTSLFGRYSDKGMLLLRNRFFKSCAFNTNIQQFFKDNGIERIEQLNGKTIATDVKDIKLITTPSSVKYLKFGSFENWLNNIEPIYGIVKHEKKTHYFDGRMVQAHYQLINTLQMTFDEVKKLIQPSLDYITKVRQDPDVLRYHIKYPDTVDFVKPAMTKNEIVFKLLGLNNKFAKTELYREFRDDVVKAFIRNLKKGHVLIEGNYSTLCGNPYEMLLSAIGKFDGTSYLGIGKLRSTKFDYGAKLLATRSPHILPGNIYLAKNVQVKEIDRYFNLTDEIVCVNSINENLHERTNGSDMDGDTILITNNELLIKVAERNYDIFKVPTNLTPAGKITRYYTSEELADLDVKTSDNKIGEIVNLSQQLNSLLWDNYVNGISLEQQENLYLDICKLAVLSGIEIDRAKRTSPINSGKEINELKEKWKIVEEGKTVKPYFFKMITTENGYKISPNVKYKYFNTPMDYLQKIIASYNFRRYREPKVYMPFSEILEPIEAGSVSSYSYRVKNRILAEIKTKKKILNKLYKGYDTKSKDEKEKIRNEAMLLKEEMLSTLNTGTWNKSVSYLLLKELDKPMERGVANFIFEALFSLPCEGFYDLLKDNSDDLMILKEIEGGEIQLYSYNYSKKNAKKG